MDEFKLEEHYKGDLDESNREEQKEDTFIRLILIVKYCYFLSASSIFFNSIGLFSAFDSIVVGFSSSGLIFFICIGFSSALDSKGLYNLISSALLS